MAYLRDRIPMSENQARLADSPRGHVEGRRQLSVFETLVGTTACPRLDLCRLVGGSASLLNAVAAVRLGLMVSLDRGALAGKGGVGGGNGRGGGRHWRTEKNRPETASESETGAKMCRRRIYI